MNGTDDSDSTRRLRELVEAELEQRTDVRGFEFQPTDDPGVHVLVEESDERNLYHVTIERHPDGSDDTHWSYLGAKHED